MSTVWNNCGVGQKDSSFIIWAATMCKRKASTKRARTAAAVGGGPLPSPVDERLNSVPPIPPEATVMVGNPPTAAASMSMHDAMILPTTGKAGLKRVFLGLGWEAGDSGQRIDVDCACAPFVKGQAAYADTVWFGNLRSTSDANGFCSIKHSGDIREGQSKTTGALEDLERIYVDLENLADNVDCLAFEGNIYQGSPTFASLSTAYIRLVNADTSQELARCSLGQGAKGGDAASMKKRVLLFAKMYRGKDRWVLHATSEGRDEELRHLAQGGTTQEDMLPPKGIDLDGAPEAKEMERDVGSKAVELGRDDALGGFSTPKTSGSASPAKAKPPSRSYLMPAVAVGTVAGIAAAVALFGPEALNPANMGADVFTSGVDFGSLAGIDLPLDCGCCHECECAGCNVGDLAGDACGGVFEALTCDPCLGSCGLESPCEGCGPCKDAMGGMTDAVGCNPCQLVGDCAGGVGNLLGGGLDALQGCTCGDGGCGGDACALFKSIDGSAVGGCGEVPGALANCCGNLPDVLGNVCGALPGLCGKLPDFAGNVCGNVGGVVKECPCGECLESVDCEAIGTVCYTTLSGLFGIITGCLDSLD